LGRRQRGLGECGFELHHLVGLLLRVGCGRADQFQRLGDVGDVGVADLLVLRLEVVVPGGKAETTLVDIADLPGRILEIGVRTEAENVAVAVVEALVEEVLDLAAVLQRIDLREFGLDRVVTQLVDGRGVHAGRIQPAEFLFEGRALVVLRILRGRLEDLSLVLQALFVQHVEAAPTGFIRRNGVCRIPLGVHVVGEVVAGVVLIVELECDRLRQGSARGGRGGRCRCRVRRSRGGGCVLCRRTGAALRRLAAPRGGECQAYGQRNGGHRVLVHGVGLSVRGKGATPASVASATRSVTIRLCTGRVPCRKSRDLTGACRGPKWVRITRAVRGAVPGSSPTAARGGSASVRCCGKRARAVGRAVGRIHSRVAGAPM